MRHVGTIAARDLRSLFVSPVAYVVLTLWSVIAGTFFIASVRDFAMTLDRLQQLQMLERIQQTNLNDNLIGPFWSFSGRTALVLRGPGDKVYTV